MARRTLLDFFDDLARIDADFVVYDDGYRVRTFTYGGIADMARAFAARLRSEGIGPDDKVVLWSENRAEWLAVLWGCLLETVVLVPVDYRSSAEFVGRIAGIVDAKAIVVGETVDAPDVTRPVWPILSAVRTPHPPSLTPHPASRTPHPASRTPHPASRTPHPA
jgi:acyl-CoA synthetase (AMP-forming)/AMP-acid ligase II